MIRLLILALLLSGCQRLSVKPVRPNSPDLSQVEQLEAAYQANLQAYDAERAEAVGFPSRTDCDGALWAGEACAGGATVAIEELEYSPGEWHRRPAPSCWTPELGDQGSKTTTSRDMITGVLACLWKKQDLQTLQRLADYAEVHGGKVGEPLDDGRVLLGLNLSGLIGRMIYALSNGGDDRPYALAFEAYLPVQEDSEQHLQALGITLQGAVVEDLRARGLAADIGAVALTDISPGMKARLEELVQGHPDDYLFQASLGVYTGDFAEATRLLLAPPPPPSYVRGDSAALFEKARWLYSAKLVLDQFRDGDG